MNYSEWSGDFSFREALEWSRYGFSFEEALEWAFEELSPMIAYEWVSYGFDFGQAIEWVAEGYSAKEAYMYADFGYRLPQRDMRSLVSERQIESWDLRSFRSTHSRPIGA